MFSIMYVVRAGSSLASGWSSPEMYELSCAGAGAGGGVGGLAFISLLILITSSMWSFPKAFNMMIVSPYCMSAGFSFWNNRPASSSKG